MVAGIHTITGYYVYVVKSGDVEVSSSQTVRQKPEVHIASRGE
jgi:hypothetical protein